MIMLMTQLANGSDDLDVKTELLQTTVHSKVLRGIIRGTTIMFTLY